jgi:hypothetical protein
MRRNHDLRPLTTRTITFFQRLAFSTIDQSLKSRSHNHHDLLSLLPRLQNPSLTRSHKTTDQARRSIEVPTSRTGQIPTQIYPLAKDIQERKQDVRNPELHGTHSMDNRWDSDEIRRRKRRAGAQTSEKGRERAVGYRHGEAGCTGEGAKGRLSELMLSGWIGLGLLCGMEVIGKAEFHARGVVILATPD